MRSMPISAQRLISEKSGEVDVLKLLNTLSRGKWRILFFTIVIGALGVYHAQYRKVPMYMATSTVVLDQRSAGGQVVDLQSPLAALQGNERTMNTEVEALMSRDLVAKLVDKMNLVEDPTFNATLRPVEEPLIDFSISDLIKQGIALVAPDMLPEEQEALPPTPDEIREWVILSVGGSISVEALRFSYVFKINVMTDNPESSMRVANGLAEVYIEDQIAQKYEATEQATAWLNSRVAGLKIELEGAENQIKSFNSDAALLGPEGLAGLNRQLKVRRDRIAATREKTQDLTARIAALEAAKATGDITEMAEIAKDPGLTQLSRRLDQTGAREAFNTGYDRLLQQASLELTRTRAQVTSLEGTLADLEDQVARQSQELLKLEQLEREAGAVRQLYEYFLGRLKETSVQQGVHRADSRLLTRAILPLFPSSPNKPLIVMVALMLGFALGCILVLLREMRQNTYRSPQELEQAVGLTVFAQVPKAPYTARRRLLKYLKTKPMSAMIEAVRNLRTSILLSSMDTPPQVIMVTSSLPGEGKTTQSLALAQSFSNMDKRVLLIEGDIRRRTLRKYLTNPKEAGLISAVAGKAPLDEIVLKDDVLGIDMLIGEKAAISAADFFSSNAFRSFMDNIREVYDVIIIDTPPVLLVSDARVIGRLADAVIYVVHWNQTTHAQVQEGLHSLNSVDVKISGLVLSQVNPRQARSYGGEYRELYGYKNEYYQN